MHFTVIYCAILLGFATAVPVNEDKPAVIETTSVQPSSTTTQKQETTTAVEHSSTTTETPDVDTDFSLHFGICFVKSVPKIINCFTKQRSTSGNRDNEAFWPETLNRFFEVWRAKYGMDYIEPLSAKGRDEIKNPNENKPTKHGLDNGEQLSAIENDEIKMPNENKLKREWSPNYYWTYDPPCSDEIPDYYNPQAPIIPPYVGCLAEVAVDFGDCAFGI